MGAYVGFCSGLSGFQNPIKSQSLVTRQMYAIAVTAVVSVSRLSGVAESSRVGWV